MTAKTLQNASDEELINADNFIDKLSLGFGGAGDHQVGYLIDDIRRLMEMERRLKDEIKAFNKTSSKYSCILIYLTIILAILSVVQIYLILR